MTGLRNVHEGLVDFKTWATDPHPRVGFGLPFFDANTRGGLALAEVAMVMAVSSVGKTWLALQAIVHNTSVPTLMVSLEMSWRQVVSRLAAITTGVPTWDLEDALKQGQTPGQFYDTMTRFPLLLGTDHSALSIKEISEAIKEAGDRLNQPIRLVVIDYLELIGGSGLLTKTEQVDRASQKVKALAKDHDCSIVILHQVGKTDGSGGYEPLDLESGRYGGHQPCDQVVGAYVPRLNKNLTAAERQAVQGDIYFQLLKNRNGMAHPDGVRHTLSPHTGRITPYGVQVPGYAVQTDLFAPDPDTYYRDADFLERAGWN